MWTNATRFSPAHATLAPRQIHNQARNSFSFIWTSARNGSCVNLVVAGLGYRFKHVVLNHATVLPLVFGRSPQGFCGFCFAIAFGCNPDTMRKHYLALEEFEISGRVMEKMQAESSGEVREIQKPPAEPTEKDLQPVVASPLSDTSSEVRETGLEPAPGCRD